MIKINLKYFFKKEFIVFCLASLAFILIMIAVFVIGFKNKNTGDVQTFNDVRDTIQTANETGITIPQYYSDNYSLNLSGLVFSGVSLIFFFLIVLPIKQLQSSQGWLWWIGLFFFFVGFVLVLTAENVFAVESLKTNGDIELKDFYDVGRFAGLIIAIVLLPLVTFTLGVIWHPQLKQRAK